MIACVVGYASLTVGAGTDHGGVASKLYRTRNMIDSVAGRDGVRYTPAL